MIFSHGFCGEAKHYIGLYQEFASHGYIVLAPDTNDGTCGYTENEKGEPQNFIDSPKGIFDLDMRKI